MDIQTFNEAIIPYCKALGLAGATAATVITSQTATPTTTPTQTPSVLGEQTTIQTTPTPTVITTQSQNQGQSGFGKLISSLTDEDLAKLNGVQDGDLLKGQWKYMPGVTSDGNALRVHPTELSLVEQDGSFSQSNPPINLAGSHLVNLTGDFQVDAAVDLQNANSAVVQLYGQAPIIADEFRIERESLRMTIQKDKVIVDLFDGNDEDPQTSKSYPVASSNILKLSITRMSNSFIFTLNAKEVGSMKDPGIFKENSLWFGLDGTGGDWLLTQLTAKSLSGSLSVIDGSLVQIKDHNPQGLQALAAKKRSGFVVGSAMALGPLTSDRQYADVALDNNMFGSLTPENDMKMINLQPQKGVYTFGRADALTALALQNGLTVHGHALVFGEATPPWFNELPVNTVDNKKLIEDIMNDHIKTVVTHFGDKVNEWDVINEPIADYDTFDSSRGRTYRRHKWYQAMGDSYMVKALSAAHSANPNAMLFINEYGLEFDGDRWDAFVGMMQKLKTQLSQENIPVEKIGVGFQSHVFEKGDLINPTVLRKHIQQMASLGFKVRISEMDVYNDDGDSIQAKQYADIFNACLSEPNCISWTTWMLSDRYDVFIDDDGSIQYGEDGLFDVDMKPRPGFTSIQSVLQK